MENIIYVYPNQVNDEFIKNIFPLLKKYKIKKKDIDIIAYSIEKSYHIGWSNGYHDCEIDTEECM